VVVPMITRVLAAGGVVVGTAVGKKRQKAGGGAAGAEAGGSSAVFVDGVSRGYIVQSSEKGSARVVVMDLLYGSVLWSGVVQGCDGVVTQVRVVLLERGSASEGTLGMWRCGDLITTTTDNGNDHRRLPTADGLPNTCQSSSSVHGT